VIRGSPASEPGLKASDKIIAVAGHRPAIFDDQSAELCKAPRERRRADGPYRDQAAPQLTLRREHVDVPSVDDIHSSTRPMASVIFKLTCFQKTTAATWTTPLAVHRWECAACMDLRGNPGGTADRGRRMRPTSSSIREHRLDPRPQPAGRIQLHGHDERLACAAGGVIDGDSAERQRDFRRRVRDHSRGVAGRRCATTAKARSRHLPLAVGGARHPVPTASSFANAIRSPTSGVEPDSWCINAKTDRRQVAPRPRGRSDATLSAGLEGTTTIGAANKPHGVLSSSPGWSANGDLPG